MVPRTAAVSTPLPLDSCKFSRLLGFQAPIGHLKTQQPTEIRARGPLPAWRVARGAGHEKGPGPAA